MYANAEAFLRFSHYWSYYRPPPTQLPLAAAAAAVAAPFAVLATIITTFFYKIRQRAVTLATTGYNNVVVYM